MRVSSRRPGLLPVMWATALLLPTAAAWAIIDPNFTPAELVDDADVILEVSAGTAKKPGTLAFFVKREFKGKAPANELTVDLQPLGKADAEEVAVGLALPGHSEALLFLGHYGEPGKREQGNKDAKAKVFMHVGGRWIELEEAGAGSYRAMEENPNLQPTWAGGTDMLTRGVEYKKAFPSAKFPVAADVAWSGRQDVARIEGGVSAARPVDLDGKPAQHLYVACEGGDRLYAWDAQARELREVTAARKLSAKSAASAWGDFNGDGRLDLANWDGRALGLHLQTADGTFGTAPLDTGLRLDGVCLGLTTIDCGKPGRPGLLVSTAGWPVLLTPEDGGSYASRPLGQGALPGGDGLGAASVCLAADFDEDLVPDALQLFEKGGLFYKGKGGGAFALPVAAEIMHCGGQSPPAVGDFDADGRLDVAVAARDGFKIWHNRGGLRFEEVMKISGEVEYKTGANGVAVSVGDFTGDGRQDLLVMYSDQSPSIFFNRGFRSFGDAVKLAPSANDLNNLEDAEIFQQTGGFGDFNGDGALDMVLVLKTGHVLFFPCGPSENAPTWAPVSVAVSLALGAGHAGPVTVTGWIADRCLGAQVVASGSPQAVFARRDADTVKLRWQLPGRGAEEKEVELEDQPLQFRIGDAGK